MYFEKGNPLTHGKQFQGQQHGLLFLPQFFFYIAVLLARFTRFWKQALHIVQPDTLLRWHRDLFRFYWRLK